MTDAPQPLALYRTFSLRELRRLRAAFQHDRVRAPSRSLCAQFCTQRIALITRVLRERRRP